MLAFSYKRFSSKQQAQGMSIERQTKLAEDYCHKHSLELSSQSFEDLGVSAWTGRNSNEDAGLGQFIQALESQKIRTPCYLLVESLDRLSRAKIQKAMRQLMDITDFDVTIVTLMDEKQYTKDMEFTDFLLAGVIMERANNESETKSKRLKAVWAKKRAEQAMHSNAPFWLDRTDEGYKINQSVSIVQRIFRLAAEGLGHYSITGILNKEQVPSPTGKGWNGSTVSKLLRSRTVIGEYQPNTVNNKVATPIGEPICGYYPIVIEEDLFNRVQLEINHRLKKYKSYRGGSTSTHRNLLRDKGKCSCQKYLSLVKKRQRYYLQCIDNRSQLCGKRAIQMDAFEKWLRQYFLSPMFHNHWIDSGEKNADIDSKINELIIAKQSSRDGLEGLLSITENLSDKLVLQRIRELSEEVSALDKRIEDLEGSKLSGNKRQSLEETSRLIDLAFAVEDMAENIAARVQLKQLLNQTFDYFELTRVDSDNGKVLYYRIELGFYGQTWKYQSIDAPTALQNAKKRHIWFDWSDKPRVELTEEQKQAVIEEFKINH
ncbi:hypothetical protein BCU85_08460 [Vibrio lentus]|uniref:recombinase family protein n=1 Tax=Vibrio lentus TaxID=136468 RepID=UPI000C84511C|nr:recombinase family protein [Vibrio lentus]MCC4818652.1 recombinase family protein [Vibrio lentus]PMG68718.1 hypothetical protein BCU85_08460 [Vibrio lentus]PML27026.1 hypothetical protein BCT80_00375 [Vibrio lentus]PMM25870.1 hypothetical protein BCT57_21940 [Vibrio lentus]